MKHYEIYRDIRKRAMVMGLPISLFALMMTSVILSLLVIIFSFSLLVIVSVLVFNIILYVTLTHITQKPVLFYFQRVFPKTISNKRISHLTYED
ncbi:hypothetical protein [Flagellimonas algicola]|uniref:Uncharacterized protein n=1 Tax=Flagellimonas algicola TaxID=2583815 RepID=A0ABY2WH52_9FLAO|nr:hypothetical protein [Allomuricauda algicola]TMU50774.1 hypothetical protein FGG15_18425 [Allomuricauda algicola]